MKYTFIPKDRYGMRVTFDKPYGVFLDLIAFVETRSKKTVQVVRANRFGTFVLEVE